MAIPGPALVRYYRPKAQGLRIVVTASDDLVTIGWAYGLSETAVAVARLEAAGVHVLAGSRQLASVAWHWSYALGGIELRVPESQARFAHEMLTDTEPSALRSGTAMRLLLALLGFLLAGVPLPPSGVIIAGASPLSVVPSRSGDPDRPPS